MDSLTQDQGIVEVNLAYSEEDRQRFRCRELSREWARAYPAIFDEDDLKLATGRQAETNHFFEWLAAVCLHQLTNYLSLVEKYDCRNHPRKHSLFLRIVGRTVFDNVMANQAGIPDLVVYSPDRSDWFFVEVKGATDRLRPHQRSRMKELYNLTGKRALVLNFARRAEHD